MNTRLEHPHVNFTHRLDYLDLAQQPIPHLTAEILMEQNAEQAALGEKSSSNMLMPMSWWWVQPCITLV